MQTVELQDNGEELQAINSISLKTLTRNQS